jgi:hypothetical protein
VPGGPPTLYSIAIGTLTNGGTSTLVANPTTASAGDTVTLTVLTPDASKQLAPSAIKVNGNAGGVSGSGTSFQFTMPALDVEVSAVFGDSGAVVHLASDGGYYGSLDEAVVAAVNPDTITVLANITNHTKMGDDSIAIGGTQSIHLSASPGPGREWVIKRWSGNTGNLFEVNGSLEIGAETGSLVIDGGADWSNGTPARGALNSSGVTANESLITVGTYGALKVTSGAILRNNEFRIGSSGQGGGAIFNEGAVEISGGKVINNRVGGTTSDPDLYGGAIKNHGTLTITNGEVSGNYAAKGPPSNSGRGGAIVNNGTFTMSGGTISDNKADTAGGGVATEHLGAIFNMSGTAIISDNTVGSLLITGSGGGVYVYEDSVFNMNGGIIKNNSAIGPLSIGYGGGVNVDDGTFYMSGGIVYGSGAGAGLANTASLLTGASLHVENGGIAKYGVGGSGAVIIPSGGITTTLSQ